MQHLGAFLNAILAEPDSTVWTLKRLIDDVVALFADELSLRVSPWRGDIFKEAQFDLLVCVDHVVLVL